MRMIDINIGKMLTLEVLMLRCPLFVSMIILFVVCVTLLLVDLLVLESLLFDGMVVLGFLLLVVLIVLENLLLVVMIVLLCNFTSFLP